jgi:hypothetical protein
VGKAALEAQDKVLCGMLMCVDKNRWNVVGFVVGEEESEVKIALNTSVFAF